jgi:hypothetical protein
MSSIKVYMKNGEVHDFPHHGRSGGSYTKTLTYKGAFAVVEDEWGKRTSFPAEDILRIEETPLRGF